MAAAEEPLGLSVANKGGYYPVLLHTLLNGRYRLTGKLGWGVYSSVWEANDVEHGDRSVAVKILSAFATNLQGQMYNELGILQRINTAALSASHPGRKHIPALLDHFKISSEHGDHLCLVFETLGLSIAKIDGKVAIPAVKSFTRQLLTAFIFLHEECEVVHTDLKPSNVLFSLPHNTENFEGGEQNNHQTSEDFYSELLPDTEIRVIDFGLAALINEPRREINVMPRVLRAPEVILGCGWSSPVDVWSIGCLVFKLLTGQWPFMPTSGPTWSAEDFHLAHMQEMVGESFELDIVRSGKYFENYFKWDGEEWSMILCVENAMDLYGSLYHYGVFKEDDGIDMHKCIDFMRAALRLNPASRATARQLLQHEWLRA